MKSLILVRHAKSSWDDPSVTDFDRPLNERGRRDAPMMAQRLLEKNIVPDALITSTARRARKTAEAFASVWNIPTTQILLLDQLYHAGPEQFRRVIAALDDAFISVAIFAHNPGITEFANQMETARIDEMPTCGIFAVTTTAHSWAEFNDAGKAFWFFDFPKNHTSNR